MKTIAECHPARTDSNGTTWYRPALTAGVTLQTWGWTSDPGQADLSYGLHCLSIVDGRVTYVLR